MPTALLGGFLLGLFRFPLLLHGQEGGFLHVFLRVAFFGHGDSSKCGSSLTDQKSSFGWYGHAPVATVPNVRFPVVRMPKRGRKSKSGSTHHNHNPNLNPKAGYRPQPNPIGRRLPGVPGEPPYRIRFIGNACPCTQGRRFCLLNLCDASASHIPTEQSNLPSQFPERQREWIKGVDKVSHLDPVPFPNPLPLSTPLIS